MASFVTFLVCGDTEIAGNSKLVGSLVAGFIGYLLLKGSQANHFAHRAGD